MSNLTELRIQIEQLLSLARKDEENVTPTIFQELQDGILSVQRELTMCQTARLEELNAEIRRLTEANEILRTSTVDKNECEEEKYKENSDTIEEDSFMGMGRGVNISKRFLFLKQLFFNNRIEMENMIKTLSKFPSRSEAEDYLMYNTDWNVSDPIVVDFISSIFKEKP